MSMFKIGLIKLRQRLHCFIRESSLLKFAENVCLKDKSWFKSRKQKHHCNDNKVTYTNDLQPKLPTKVPISLQKKTPDDAGGVVELIQNKLRNHFNLKLC